MNFVCDPVNIINIILCTAIVILGLMANAKKRNPVPLMIAIAFGLFGIAHILTIMGLHESLEYPLIAIRTAGYLIVIDAMYHSIKRAIREK